MKNDQNRFGKGIRWCFSAGLALWTIAVVAQNAVAQTNTFPSSGAVGIGTTSPSQLLDIQGSSEPLVAITNTGMSGSPSLVVGMNSGNNAALFQATSGKDFKFYNGQYALTILGANGNVGIGTNSPSARLQVSGGSMFVTDRGDGCCADIRMFGGDSSQETHIYSYGTGYGSGRFGIHKYGTGSAGGEVFSILPNGKVGIGTTAPSTALEVVGDLTVSGNISAKYQDLAEWVSTTQFLPAGTVVVLDTEIDNGIVPSFVPYDTRVAGVVSDSPGIILGVAGPGKLKIATTGRVKVHVDASNGPIRRGDLLVTGTKEGTAMRSEMVTVGRIEIHRPGTLIGKALEPLESGEGEILVLLSLQ